MKTFSENYKIAKVLAKKALKKDGFFKYSLYYLMKWMFTVIILLTPFLVSKWRIASQIKEDNKISLTGLFEPVSGKGYFHLLAANLIKIAMYVGVLLFLALCGFILYWFGFGIGTMNPQMLRKFPIFPFLFIAPAAIVLVGLIISLPFINVPNGYIINNYPLLTPGRVLKYSFYSLKNGGKSLMFKTLLFEYGLLTLYLAAGAGISLLPYFLIKGNLGVGLMIVLITIFSAGYIYLLPLIQLISLLIRSNIYDEVVFVKNSNSLTEININSDDIVISKNNTDTLNSLFKIERKKVEATSYQNSLEENEKEAKREELRKQKEVVLEKEISEEPIEDIEEEELLNEVLEEPTEDVPVEEPVAEPEAQEEPIEQVEEPQLEEAPTEETPVESEPVVQEPQTEEVAEEKVEEAQPVEEQPIPEVKEETPAEVHVEEVKPEEVETSEPQVEEKVEEEVKPEEPQAEPEVTREEKIEEPAEDPDLDELLNSIPEKAAPQEEASELDEIPEEALEEINGIDDSELDELLNSIPEAKPVTTKKKSSEDDLDALLNSIPDAESGEADEDLDALLDSIPEKETKKEKKTKTTKKTTKKKGE